MREAAMEADRRPERADDVGDDEHGHVQPVEGDPPEDTHCRNDPSGGSITATSVTTWLIRLVPGRTVTTSGRCSTISIGASVYEGVGDSAPPGAEPRGLTRGVLDVRVFEVLGFTELSADLRGAMCAREVLGGRIVPQEQDDGWRR
jgi:hypothetical protein